MSTPLNREEWGEFAALLRRVSENMDQFEHLRVETADGPCFVDITWGVMPGVDPEIYVLLDGEPG